MLPSVSLLVAMFLTEVVSQLLFQLVNDFSLSLWLIKSK